MILAEKVEMKERIINQVCVHIYGQYLSRVLKHRRVTVQLTQIENKNIRMKNIVCTKLITKNERIGLRSALFSLI